jgi:hypothetical protein
LINVQNGTLDRFADRLARIDIANNWLDVEKITDAVDRRQPDMSETSHMPCIPITPLHEACVRMF